MLMTVPFWLSEPNGKSSVAVRSGREHSNHNTYRTGDFVRASIVVALALSAGGALFTGSIPPARSQTGHSARCESIMDKQRRIACLEQAGVPVIDCSQPRNADDAVFCRGILNRNGGAPPTAYGNTTQPQLGPSSQSPVPPKANDPATAAALQKAKEAMGFDNLTAYRILLGLANRGVAEAEQQLGELLSEGYSNIPTDYPAAITLFRRAAGQGYMLGAINLAQMYQRGGFVSGGTLTGKGIPKDYATAVTWYRTALDRGDALIKTLARMGLADIYAQGGYGVEQDYEQAYKFFDIAAMHKSSLDFGDCAGDFCLSKAAAFSRDQLAVKMTQDQINEAQRLARSEDRRLVETNAASMLPAAPSAQPQVNAPDPCAPVNCLTGDCDRLIREAQTAPVSHWSCFVKAAKGIKTVPDLFQVAANAAQDASRVFCARNARLACSTYMTAANQCAGYISDTHQMFMNLRAFEGAGMTSAQAGREVYKTMVGDQTYTAQGHYMPYDVLALVIPVAAQISQEEEVGFAWNVFSTCLKAADQ